MAIPLVDTASPIVEFSEKAPLVSLVETSSINPVVESAEFAYNVCLVCSFNLKSDFIPRPAANQPSPDQL